ncbi:MAG: hypothetical protein QN133_08000 [Armatimonadota bacterium]|nr:hypothetical protein [Armatimonadota bacterium]MDR7429720.1 hypothetical protein [Armatimonadota bacterium]MDR7432484.1 hypothetical protein [Armatimonadota bacterium]MDR7514288.1 hypothetical protein [Armatimonadota bacterium]MDR7577485.1 hypothetical protein [Armatimonadota bacterium]
MNPVERYVEACREVLRCTREVARAVDRGQWEAVLAHLVARQRAMDAADRLPVPSRPELQDLRAQALVLLEEAARLNHRVTDRLRRLRDLLRPVVAPAEPHFLDTYR